MLKLERDAFAARMLKALRRSGDATEFVYDSEYFSLVGKDDASVRLNLHNAYETYRALPFWRRSSSIDGFARSIAQSMSLPDIKTLDQARPLLKPVVRSRIYLQHVFGYEFSQANDPIDLPHRLLAEHLTLEVCIDLPTAIRSTTADDLRSWGVAFDDALAIGMDNLRRVSQHDFERHSEGVYLSPWRDNFDASRIVLPDLLDRLAIKGRPVAMIPNRDVLIVTGDRDPPALARAASLVEPQLMMPRPLSGLAFRLGAGWEPYMPDAGDGSTPILSRLSALDSLIGYRQQTQDLTRRNEDAHVDVFIASLLPQENGETREIRTFTTWSDGVTALLPRAGYVVFGGMGPDNKADIRGAAPWARVQAAAGSLMKDQAMYPPRFLVDQYPSPEQLDAMKLERFMA